MCDTEVFTGEQLRAKDSRNTQIEKWVRDVDTVQEEWKIERVKLRDERRRSDSSRRYASDYQPVSDALGTDKEEERDTERKRTSLWSRTVKMTDVKNLSSVELPEGKLMKKVSACRCKNMQTPVNDALKHPTWFNFWGLAGTNLFFKLMPQCLTLIMLQTKWSFMHLNTTLSQKTLIFVRN